MLRARSGLDKGSAAVIAVLQLALDSSRKHVTTEVEHGLKKQNEIQKLLNEATAEVNSKHLEHLDAVSTAESKLHAQQKEEAEALQGIGLDHAKRSAAENAYLAKLDR